MPDVGVDRHFETAGAAATIRADAKRAAIEPRRGRGAPDGRTVWARRLKTMMDRHLADLGGRDQVSEAKRSIMRRAAVIEVELERMEAGWAALEAGGAAPSSEALDLYQRTSNSLRRLLESVGLERVPRDVTPKLGDYLAGKARKQPPPSRQADEAEIVPSPPDKTPAIVLAAAGAA